MCEDADETGEEVKEGSKKRLGGGGGNKDDDEMPCMEWSSWAQGPTATEVKPEDMREAADDAKSFLFLFLSEVEGMEKLEGVTQPRGGAT